VIIVGAGMAGLIAGHVFPTAKILERATRPAQSHAALLRFRSDAVSLVTGIPFRRVRVHKALWYQGAYTEPNPRLANLYSAKVAGRYLPRSVWDLEAVDRWIAPDDFYDRMVEVCAPRIQWNADVTNVPDNTALVSTIPLPEALLRFGGLAGLPVNFDRAPISVSRWQIADSDVHQTVYFPDHATSTYRASITGDILIVESMTGPDVQPPLPAALVLNVFGITSGATSLGVSEQRFGKIAPISEMLRKELIHQLTTTNQVYSLGRFATWRNLLLDDVVKDARIIKQMIEQGDAYSRRLHSVS